MIICCISESEVTCCQVWSPILGICALHLTHPSAPTQQWTHTRSSGQPMLRHPGSSWGFGALLKGLTSLVVLKVEERVLVIHSPHRQFLPDLRLELTTCGLQVWLSIHDKSTTAPYKYKINIYLLFYFKIEKPLGFIQKVHPVNQYETSRLV